MCLDRHFYCSDITMIPIGNYRVLYRGKGKIHVFSRTCFFDTIITVPQTLTLLNVKQLGCKSAPLSLMLSVLFQKSPGNSLEVRDGMIWYSVPDGRGSRRPRLCDLRLCLGLSSQIIYCRCPVWESE